MRLIIKCSIYAIFAFLIVVPTCCDQKDTSKKNINKDSTSFIIADSSLLDTTKLSALDFFLKTYSDSIDNIQM